MITSGVLIEYCSAGWHVSWLILVKPGMTKVITSGVLIEYCSAGWHVFWLILVNPGITQVITSGVLIEYCSAGWHVSWLILVKPGMTKVITSGVLIEYCSAGWHVSWLILVKPGMTQVITDGVLMEYCSARWKYCLANPGKAWNDPNYSQWCPNGILLCRMACFLVDPGKASWQQNQVITIGVLIEYGCAGWHAPVLSSLFLIFSIAMPTRDLWYKTVLYCSSPAS